MNRITISIGILFIIVLGLNLPFWLQEETKDTAGTQDDSWLPNYQAKGMKSSLYDKNGKLNHQVFAKTMEHYELLGFTLFEAPEYTIFTNDGAEPWKVTASEGTLYEDNRIQLETNVRIKSLNPSSQIQTLTTEFIEIDLNTRTIVSDQSVEITGEGFKTIGTGFNANLITETFTLDKHVQTLYDPK
ncbi:LPS export ABC transporter periplasmic protein LptC [Alteromonadaceae bacterium M269]|nr:LPS export ABC transporter periplasmic protein LptC [Alteromonadaceae bacterium M269]